MAAADPTSPMRASSMKCRLQLVAAVFGLLLLAPPASAVPVVHTVNPGASTNLTGDIEASLHIDVFIDTFPDLSGNVTASGVLDQAPTGSLLVDWGSPGWADRLLLTVDTPIAYEPVGTGTGVLDLGSLDLGLLGSIDFEFDLDIVLDSLSITALSDFDVSPLLLSQTTPGAGPWLALPDPVVDVEIDAALTATLLGPLGIDLDVPTGSLGPLLVNDLQIPVTLERLGGNPGTGTRALLPIFSNTIDLAPPAPIDVAVPGCEVDTTLGCVLDVETVRVTFDSLTLSNLSGTIVADQGGIAIPEPSLLVLLGIAVAGFVAVVRRGR